MKLAILVLASGQSSRLGGPIPKVYLSIGGKTVLIRCLERLAQLGGDQEIIVAINSSDRDRHLPPLRPDLDSLGVTLVDGGATRQESMRRAFAAATPGCELILIHDAARPFFPLEATKDLIQQATDHGAALLAIPAPDTLKRVDEHAQVSATLDRQGIFLAQTPQAIQRPILEAALAHASASGFEGTDDVSLVEALPHPVKIVLGSPKNIKITTRQDLEFAELLATLENTDS